MEKIVFDMGEGEQDSFYVLEQAKLSGVNYILVTQEEEGDGEALILKEISTDKKDTTYEVVTDDDELSALSSLFESLLEDCTLE